MITSNDPGFGESRTVRVTQADLDRRQNEDRARREQELQKLYQDTEPSVAGFKQAFYALAIGGVLLLIGLKVMGLL